ARLVDRCLLTAGHDGHEMLQTVRRYAGERLVEAGEADRLDEAHARFVVGWAESVAGRIGLDDDRGFVELSDAVSDLRTAHHWARRHDPDLAMRLSAALWIHTELRGDNEARTWAEVAIRLPGTEGHPMRPAVLASAAMGAGARGDADEAALLIGEAVRTADLGHRSTPPVWWGLGMMLLLAGDFSGSLRALHLSWRLARRHDDRWFELVAAAGMTAALSYLGHRRGSERWLRRCFATLTDLPGPTAHAVAELAAGECRSAVNPDSALASIERCRDLASRVGARLLVVFAASWRATVRARLTTGREALRHYADAVVHWAGIGDRLRLWIHVQAMIPLYCEVGEDEVAIALDAAVSTSPAIASPMVDWATLRRTVAQSEVRLGDRATEIRMRWTGAPAEAVVDLVTGRTTVERPATLAQTPTAATEQPPS
ncbi:hypothetical protein ACGFIY_33860, partial [Micromonospora chersina]|uniref:hypothetical protein n=1 Tax=Micromonospora chersina TaxID=47854 RepID=UPI00371D27BF